MVKQWMAPTTAAGGKTTRQVVARFYHIPGRTDLDPEAGSRKRAVSATFDLLLEPGAYRTRSAALTLRDSATRTSTTWRGRTLPRSRREIYVRCMEALRPSSRLSQAGLGS